VFLTGLIFAAYGFIFKKYPPAMGEGIGYRTSLTKKNEDTWTTANTYSANVSMIGGAVLICLGLISPALPQNIVNTDTLTGVGLIPVILMTPVYSFIIILIFATETHLNKLFDENGNRR
jgi:hypothetical protein